MIIFRKTFRSDIFNKFPLNKLVALNYNGFINKVYMVFILWENS